MPSFYVTSRNALFRLRRNFLGLPTEKASSAEISAMPLPPTPASRRCRDNDAVGTARRAKETMERNHLI